MTMHWVTYLIGVLWSVMIRVHKMKTTTIVLLISLCSASYTLFAKGVDVENATIALSLTTEPPNLDSTLSTDTVSGFVLDLVTEGLVVSNRKGGVDPGMAERWEINDLEVTFYLREAFWSDGKPVTASDFVYSFKRLVDPKTGAGGSTVFAYLIENAQDILDGKKPVDSLAVTAVSDREFRVRMSQPAPYFLTVLSSREYRPLRRDFIEAQGGRYGADAKNLLFNGPFILHNWVHSSSLELRKNPDYWDRENIRLKAINFGYITSDMRSLLNLYKSEELAALRLNEEILADTLETKLRIRKAPTNCLSWIMLNLKPGSPMTNLKLRQAIRLALDRETYVYKIVGIPGTRLVDSIFTDRMRGETESFQKEYPAQAIEYNVGKARILLSEAKKEMGIEQFPPLVMLVNETRQIEAEFVQSQLINALDLDIKVDKQTFKQSLVKFNNGEFDLARSGFCAGTLTDPVFFASIFTSTSPFNYMQFDYEHYDALFKKTSSTADQSVRMRSFGEMQQILYDQVPIIPTQESAWVYVQDNRLTKVVRYPTVIFSRARVRGVSN
ncbi:MAG TPA: peptide ABC transporter substrate-binding protein [Gammaproteobacteria bacterium]|nr:peptide ABC transporter substrate-binding protein [Gammaproteobacteria bacterium]